MLKFLLILLLVFFLLGRIGWWIIRLILKGAVQRAQQTQHRNQGNDGDIKIDYIPEQELKKRRNKGDKGGEYVDYEEVK